LDRNGKLKFVQVGGFESSLVADFKNGYIALQLHDVSLIGNAACKSLIGAEFSLLPTIVRNQPSISTDRLLALCPFRTLSENDRDVC
jgi:hypothetical protein